MLQRLQQKSGPILPLWHAAIMWEGPCGLPRVTWKGPGDMPYMASQHVDGPLGPYGLPRVTWKGLGDMPYMARNLWTGPWLPQVTWKGPYGLPRVTWKGPYGLPRVTLKGPGDMPYMASQHVDGPLGPCSLPRVMWKGPGDMPYMASQHVDGPLGPYGLPRVTWKGPGDMPYMARNLWTGPWLGPCGLPRVTWKGPGDMPYMASQHVDGPLGPCGLPRVTMKGPYGLPRVTWKGPYRLPARVTRHIWHYNTCTGRWVVQETSLQHVEVPVQLTADDMKGAADDMDWAFGLPRVTYPTRQPMYGWGFGSMWLTSDDMEGSPSHAIHGNGLRCNISNSGPTSGNIKQTCAAYMAGDVGGSLAVKKVVECRVPER
ncbi:hypothetical protein EDD15DRAFT_2197795 [Pisolithus albus]|nr:hypothetical protein EDD15DRAFT_2197795 [Pisolithus albus]